MDPADGFRPRGRGRGSGSQRSNPPDPEDGQPSSTSSIQSWSRSALPGSSASSTCSTSSSVGRGRGRGQGIVQQEPVSISFDPSPVSLPENPEEDDFLARFRRLQLKGPTGKGRGRGFSFSSCPSESSDSGVASRSGITSLLTPAGDNEGMPKATVSVGYTSRMATPDLGTEDYSELERVTVIRRGDKGKRVPIVANYLRLSIEKDMGIYEYHVDFEPPVESFPAKKKIISAIAEKLGSARNFDGAKLYLAKELSKKIAVFSVAHPNNPNLLITLTIKLVKKNSLTECVHFYNVLFRRIMEKLGLIEMKRHFFNHQAVYDLPQHKLEIWPGYVTAIDEYEGGLMLCCDSSFRVLRTSTILDIWNNFQIDSANAMKDRQNFTNYMMGKVVLTRYNNRHYRIDDVDWNQTPRSTFTNSKGQEITFLEYYKVAYNLVIRDMTQPMLVHRPKPNQEVGPVPLICLVPELCYITGMDSSITSNYTIMKDLAKYTKLTPQQRNLALKNYVENIYNCSEAVTMLQAWGLTLEEAAVRLEGRVLTIPQVSINRNLEFHPDNSNFGDKILNNRVYEPIAVRNWVLLFTRHDREKANRCIDVYRQVARPFGIAYTEPLAINVGSGSLKDFRIALEQHLHRDLQFVFAIFPSVRDDLYAMFKRMCTVDRPIPSQVVLSKTLQNERRIRSIMQKIVLQINCKLGGSLWSIRIPLPEKIMFLGMDVYHDPRRKSPSVTAIVASLNLNHTKYYSRVIFQPRHQETVNSMSPILMDLLGIFYEENNSYPDRIIVWRDGVSDGQLDFTKNHEVCQITQAFKTLSINPKFTFCVVQKRINTRLFLERGQYLNPEPGTVVDHTVTRKYLYDFFLVSQLVREGTVTPTHYIVLEDNAEVPPDLIQKFAFATSFMYYNWTGSIRVPAMCQYAHKLASLVGQYVQAEPSLELSKNLYYL